MTRQRRKIITVIVLIVEILALILVTFGLYTRLAGAGNPVGSVYIWVGCFLAFGGAFAILSVSQKEGLSPKRKLQQVREIWKNKTEVYLMIKKLKTHTASFKPKVVPIKRIKVEVDPLMSSFRILRMVGENRVLS